jgi:UDP-N-acetylmuramoylalanine--D-glutamate ligase
MKQPTVWIVGGKDKGNDYTEIEELVKKKVKAIICMGLDNSKIINFFKDKKEIIIDTASIEDAVKAAKSLQKKEMQCYFLLVVQVLIYSIITSIEANYLKKKF